MDLQSVIESIWECKRQGIHYPPEWKGKFSLHDGYQVQLGILDMQLKNGARLAGWKVGLVAKAIQDQLDIHQRVFGHFLENDHLPTGVSLEFDDLLAPLFETELCVTLGAPLKGPGVTPEAARAAISAVAPGIELVEKRGDFAGDLPLTMADNVQQKYFITAPPTEPLPPGDVLSKAVVEVLINGETVDSGSGEDIMDGPEGSVAWLANKLSEFGKKLEKGQQIMTGSFTRQHPIAKGDLIEVNFTPYGSVRAEFQ
ncbi:MAG: fumarylacetoacetate hydrolase family protein [SAR324 cluster bacterium]|nr:fumarylacetoacetate hydrolase family protein [SAR324 cluster bacterium]MCH8885122.1 fumarylacetoacetate hydrolase family protein [SAR324 cluster bacterium]